LLGGTYGRIAGKAQIVNQKYATKWQHEIYPGLFDFERTWHGQYGTNLTRSSTERRLSREWKTRAQSASARVLVRYVHQACSFVDGNVAQDRTAAKSRQQAIIVQGSDDRSYFLAGALIAAYRRFMASEIFLLAAALILRLFRTKGVGISLPAAGNGL